MKSKFVILSFAAAAIATQAHAQKKNTKAAPVAPPTVAAAPLLKNKIDSLSYAIGLNVAETIKMQGLKVNADVVGRAMGDYLTEGGKTLIEPQSAQSFISNYFMEKQAAVANENLAKGKAYLEENKKKQGITAMPNGIQYQVVTAGTGPKPTLEDKVKVNYEGRLIDGTVFDSSYKRNQPATFGLTQVIKGWTETLQQMPVGSKWTVTIPADLAYGMQAPPNIGPNQVLIFDIELLEIVK